MKKLLAFFTAVIMFTAAMTGSFAVSAENQAYGDMADTQNNISVEGTNTFGTMLASEISAKQAEQEENNGYNVFSVEMTGKTAKAEVQTLSDAELVVGIYSEDGKTLIASGNAAVTSEDTVVSVDIVTDAMPQYYYIKAFLVNPDGMRPLCTVYENPNYTKEMQEFLSKSVSDFEANKVLNLDNDPDNNFAVYNDETILVESTGETNKIVTADDTNHIYVIENADDKITSLKQGDIFSHTYNDTEMIIVKVASISVEGTTATITGQELSYEEVFDYIKIDESTNTDDCTVDTSDMDSGLTYLGQDTAQPLMSRAIEMEDSFGKKFNFGLDKKLSDGNGSEVQIKGGLDFSVKASYKLYYDANLFEDDIFYIEFTLSQSVGVSASVNGKMSAEIKLPTVYLFNNGLISCELNSKFVFEASGTLEFSVQTVKTDGFSYDSETDQCKDLSASPKTEFETKIEGRIFVGLKGDLSLKITAFKEELASAALNIEAGVEISAKKDASTAGTVPGVKHDCTTCLDGDVNFIAKASVEMNVLDLFNPKADLVNVSHKLGDFYISVPHGFGLGECPYLTYCLTVNTVDNFNKPIESVNVSCEDSQAATGTVGKAEFYLQNGKYNVSASNELYETKNTTVRIDGSPKDITLCLSKKSSSGDPDNPSSGLMVKQTELSHWYSAAVMANGDLYTWGDNDWGKLGDGTDTDSYVPIKVMSDVSSVSLGNLHSAAVRTNGDLYTWGYNYCGILGNGTVDNSHDPIKILSNVSSVSLGYNHSAAITTNGDLYTWGDNIRGQLGDGTTKTSWSPSKIMSNVASVSLGEYYGAAITTNGDLYTWGWNGNGQLGDGTTTKSCDPIKIMSNVVSVSLGQNHSAAITTNGDLYTWGSNGSGQLGDGTTTDSYVPIKIMSDVSSVSLGSGFSAAITTNGDLYTWGSEFHGSLGNGTAGESKVPVKIMSNVSFVNLGQNHGSAITISGDLYTWGYNAYGQLGNGTTTDGDVPIKIELPPISTAAYAAEPALAVAESPNRTVSGLIPNEIYNIYGMKSRKAAEPFAADNLLYISQAVSDSTGTLTFDYLPDEECPNPEIFVKAMTEFDVPNAQINYAEIKDGSASLKWDSVPGASKYTVYSVRNGVYIKEADVTGLEYTVSGLMGNSEYGFMVQSWVNGEYSLPDKGDTVYLMSEKVYGKGDVNKDGNVNADDIAALRKVLSGEATKEVVHDINGDNSVDNWDLSELRKLASAAN